MSTETSPPPSLPGLPGTPLMPSWRSPSGRGLRFCLILIGVFILGAWGLHALGGWTGALFLITPACILLIGVFVHLRHLLARRPVLRLDPAGIAGAQGPLLPWQRIARIDYTGLPYAAWLEITMTVPPGEPDPRAAWARRRRSQRRIALSALDQTLHMPVLHAALRQHQQAAPEHARALDAAHEREQQASDAFHTHLDTLSSRPWAMIGMMGLCVLAWLAGVLAGMDPMTPTPDSLYGAGGNATSAVQAGESWRLLTAMFLHGGAVHLALNMYALWGAGRLLTRWGGNRGFLLVYLASGLAGGALSLHFAAQLHVSVGASGAVFGVAGAVSAILLRSGGRYPIAQRSQLITSMAIFIGYSLFYGFTNSGIDNAAHLGGLVAGVLLGLLMAGHPDAATSARQRLTREALGALLCLVAVPVLVHTAAPAARDLAHFTANLHEIDAVRQSTHQQLQQIEARRMREAGHAPGSTGWLDEEAKALQTMLTVLRSESGRLAALPWGSDDPVGHYAQAEIAHRHALTEQIEVELEAMRIARSGAPPSAELAARRKAVQASVQQARDALNRRAAEIGLVKRTP